MIEHVGGGGLLLESFAQILRARLNFIEQAHVFDGNHCLIGKGLKQLHMMGGKGTRLLAG